MEKPWLVPDGLRSRSSSDICEAVFVPNNTASPEFWAFWDEVRELTCPETTFVDGMEE